MQGARSRNTARSNTPWSSSVTSNGCDLLSSHTSLRKRKVLSRICRPSPRKGNEVNLIPVMMKLSHCKPSVQRLFYAGWEFGSPPIITVFRIELSAYQMDAYEAYTYKISPTISRNGTNSLDSGISYSTNLKSCCTFMEHGGVAALATPKSRPPCAPTRSAICAPSLSLLFPSRELGREAPP